MKLHERSQEAPDAEEIRIAEAVHTALESYFEMLSGTDPDGLYELVISEVERPLFQCVMYHCGGNQTKAARILGINRGTLRKKLKHYQVN